MSFNRYVITSLLFHLLFISFLAATHPIPKTPASIFNVDIVGPFEIEIPSPQKAPKQEVTRKKPPDPKLLPETIYGEGIESTHQPVDDLDSSADSNSSGSQNPPTEEKSLLSSGAALVPRSFLFDRETIEKFAKKDSPNEKNLTFDISEFKHRGYMRMLKEKIESIWEYPEEAARLGISGDLYIRFSIKRDGRLGEVELIRTSGYKDLDEAAIKALKDAEPFWPLPEDYEKDELKIKGHFIYILGSTYIM